MLYMCILDLRTAGFIVSVEEKLIFPLKESVGLTEQVVQCAFMSFGLFSTVLFLFVCFNSHKKALVQLIICLFLFFLDKDKNIFFKV